MERFIQTRVVKRLEAFRVYHASRDSCRKLLLSLSCDFSSVYLLYFLHTYRSSQFQRTGRAGFNLAIFSLLPACSIDRRRFQERLEIIRSQFPQYEYACGTEDAISECGSLIENSNVSVAAALDIEARKQLKTPNMSSWTDFTCQKRMKVGKQAAALGCEAILWGDTSTRLAEIVMSEIAKGHGRDVSAVTSEGYEFEGIRFFYPLRDVMRKDVVALTSLIGHPIPSMSLAYSNDDDTNHRVSNGNDDLKIDKLMHNYFKDLERRFPSIVDNVVCTSSKLSSS